MNLGDKISRSINVELKKEEVEKLMNGDQETILIKLRLVRWLKLIDEKENIVNGTFGEYCPWCGSKVGEPHGKHYFP